jgi:hypothetical protein
VNIRIPDIRENLWLKRVWILDTCKYQTYICAFTISVGLKFYMANLVLCKTVIYTIGGHTIELCMSEILLKGEIFGVRSIYGARSGYIASNKYSQIFVMARVSPVSVKYAVLNPHLQIPSLERNGRLTHPERQKRLPFYKAFSFRMLERNRPTVTVLYFPERDAPFSSPFWEFGPEWNGPGRGTP